jgi:MFS family permease
MNDKILYDALQQFVREKPAPPLPEGPLSFRKGRKAFLVVSIAAYVVMLFSPVFLHVDQAYPEGDPYGGLECLLLGWFLTPIWYVNPVIFFMWSQLKRVRRPILWPGVVALIGALFLWVPAASPGPPLWGAWVWLFSIASAMVGCALAGREASEGAATRPHQ